MARKYITAAAGKVSMKGISTSAITSATGPAQTPVVTATQAAPTKAERRAEAKAKGYEGEMCSECGNFTLVRNGTCMKCDTCGSTTGCS